jgi:Tfp pilus assembly protein PilF
MKYLLGPILLLLLQTGVIAQDTQSTSKQTPAKPKPKSATVKNTTPVKSSASAPKKVQTAKQKPALTTKPKTPKLLSEAEEYAKASATENPAEKVSALKAFLEKFQASKKRADALEIIAVIRIKLAQDKLTAAETEGGIELLKTAMEELPTPVPEKLFNESISKIPSDLFNNGQRSAALEIASLIEGKIGDNAAQILNLAGFFLITENGLEARTLADRAIAIAPSSPAYQTLGLAFRLNFQLDEASQAYSKALELEPGSPAILRSLADLRRAQGKPEEALDLYRRILEKESGSVPAQTGLILALFDAGKRVEAEAEMAKSLEQNPNNVILLAGAAYWYAAHDEPDKAIEYSRQAIEKEPRYIWSHIALAHGYLEKKQPADAEQALLKARVYGNFPTLEYEIASARLMSGFYRDAADELRKSFSIKEGIIHTKLGGRIDSEQNGFIEVLANERRASTFEPESADDQETAERLKALLEFDQTVNTAEPNEDAAAKAADTFVGGYDRMKLHRQLYAASSLLSRRIALSKVADLAQAAVGNADAALDVPDPGAAVMASELYDSRALALTRNELIKVPEVPRAMLSAILRGRIEEIAGWALFNQNKPADAVVRLRRAVSVMPDKSAWWRASMWRLGAALQADGKDTEALDSYIKSYSIDKPDGARFVVVESLYRKVHGNSEGLEAKIGKNPMPAVTQEPNPNAVAANTEAPKADMSQTTDSSAAVKTDAATIKPEAVPSPEIVATPTPEAIPAKIAEPTPSPEAKLTPRPSPSVAPETTPTPAPESTPSVAPETTPTPAPESTASVAPEPTPTPASVEPTPAPTLETTPTPTPDATTSETKTEAAKTEPTPTPSLGTPVETKSTEKADTQQEQKSAEPPPVKTRGQAQTTAVKKPGDSSVAENTGKQLFEPVIITIPRQHAPKKAEGSPEKKANETESASGTDKTKKTADDVNDGKSSDIGSDSGQIRPRVIGENEVTQSDAPTCSISVSQDSISILNNGGSLGILVHMEGEGDLKSIKAVSNSPDDVQITLEPEIAGVKGQVFYVIHSLSAKTGDFKVAFIAPCGRKEMSVTVR